MAMRTGERARATAERDGIHRRQGNTRVAQYRLDHGQQLLRMQARNHFVVAQHLAVMQQSNGASFGSGIQGQQGGHRAIHQKKSATL